MPRGRRRDREFWITNVEQHGRKFRFRVYGGSDSGLKTFETREAAEAAKRTYERAAVHLKFDKDIQEAMNEYELWKRDPNGKGNKPRSVDTTMDRLNRFFRENIRTLPLYKLTEAKCQQLYNELTKQVAVDTHRGTLSCVKTFLEWCVKKKWITKNPAKEILGTGKRKSGEQSKPQLRIDEVRRFTDVALWLCTYGADALSDKGGRRPQHGIGGPAAALASFFLGLRADEIASRQVRDLDDAGRTLWVIDTKTAAGRRRQKVPGFLQPILRELTFQPVPPTRSRRSDAAATTNRIRKGPTDKLFGGRRWWVHDWVQRICDLAGAPIVCAHAMRGLHITLALQQGETADAVTRAVGHEYASFKSTTLKHYAQPGAQEGANLDRVLGVVLGAANNVTDQSATPAAPVTSAGGNRVPAGGSDSTADAVTERGVSDGEMLTRDDGGDTE